MRLIIRAPPRALQPTVLQCFLFPSVAIRHPLADPSIRVANSGYLPGAELRAGDPVIKKQTTRPQPSVPSTGDSQQPPHREPNGVSYVPPEERAGNWG